MASRLLKIMRKVLVQVIRKNYLVHLAMRQPIVFLAIRLLPRVRVGYLHLNIKLSNSRQGFSDRMVLLEIRNVLTIKKSLFRHGTTSK